MKPINQRKSISGWVICNRPTDTLTKGKKYNVRGCFNYLNTYGAKGDRYQQWDAFLTIKNDFGFTVKVNASKFSQCEPPLSDAQRIRNLENEVETLKQKLNGLQV